MKVLLFLGLSLAAAASAFGQHLNDFSPLYPFTSPATLNPAATGQFLDRNDSYKTYLRLESNSWFNTHLNTFYTGVRGDYRVPVFKQDFVGLGINYELTTSFDNEDLYNQVNIRGSYQKYLGGRRAVAINAISLGVDAGLNLSGNEAAYYIQKTGLAWLHKNNRQIYQVGLSHNMMHNYLHRRFSTLETEHWLSLQVYGEWELSKKINLNGIINYRLIVSPFYWKTFARERMAGTLGMSYDFGKRSTHELVVGFGMEWLPRDKIRQILPPDYQPSLGYQFYLGYQGEQFNVRVYYAHLQELFYLILDDTGMPIATFVLNHQIGLSVSYRFRRHSGLGNGPTF